MFNRLLALLFPPKCILCRELLSRDETDLCHKCRIEVPEFTKPKNNLSFIAHWTAVWYYKDSVRLSLLRFKFSGRRSYADAYGRLLAMKLQSNEMDDFDILTFVPSSFRRKQKRGFDHVRLIAGAVARELNVPLTSALKKIRHTPPQSSILDASKRRANVLGVYRVITPEQVKGKRILLIDDIVTTGSTVSECARVLLTAGAKEVILATVAASARENKKGYR